MTETFDFTTEDTPPEYVSNGQKEQREKEKLASLLDAPDLATFIKKPKTATAREYERKTSSLLKACMIGTLHQGQYADAATFLKYGPGFAAAAGELADQNETAQQLIDFIASPANPWAMFIMAALPMVAQLTRNREPDIITRKEKRSQRNASIEPVQMKIPFRKKPVNMRIKFRLKIPSPKKMMRNVWLNMRSQTYEPQAFAVNVFSNPHVRNALAKQGIDVPPVE